MAIQHTDDGYSKHQNFEYLTVCNMVLIYLSMVQEVECEGDRVGVGNVPRETSFTFV